MNQDTEPEAEIAAQQTPEAMPEPTPSPEVAPVPETSLSEARPGPKTAKPGPGRPFSGRVTLTCRPLAGTAARILAHAKARGIKPGEALDEILAEGKTI